MNQWEELQSAAMSGRVSRREFMRRATALGVATSLASGVLAKAGYAQTPVKGGTLRVGIAGGSTTDSLDIRTYTDTTMINVSTSIYDGFVEVDDKNQIQPELLESLEPSDDATEWVCNVRQGITFSNGKTLDAEDIIYSLNLHRGEGSQSGAAGPMKPIKDVVKMSDSQVKIVLEAPDADLPYVLSDYHLLVVPKDFTDWANPIGTGGYKLEAFEPGVRAVLTNRGGYWKEGRCNLEAAELSVINDDAARMQALLAGEVDVSHRVVVSLVDQIQAAGNFELVQAAAGYHFIMPMMCDKKPYDNLDTRLALKYAFNRQKLVELMFGKFARVGNDHPIPESDPFHNNELPQREYDPEKALFHAKKAGLGTSDVILQASDAAFNGAIDMSVLFQATAAAAGINVTVKREPADGFWDNVWLKAPFMTSYWGGRPAATQMLAVAYSASAPWNDTHWRVDAFEKLLADAKATTDQAKRKDYIWEMQRMLHEEGGALIPLFKDWLDVHDVKVKGHTPHGMFDLCNSRIVQKAWIEA
ncbi:MAG TPA: ABC transporter substrate-binding protein [Dongiaceae bacterium]|nr:ABC transporter substrate-binding protein [Dongiaceae bacterium]